MEFGLRDSFWVEVPFVDDEEVARGVIVGGGVARKFRRPHSKTLPLRSTPT